MTNRREYTAKFRLEAVKLVKETGQASTKIAKDLGIDGSMLSKWVRKYDG
ncbi:MAG: transposase, partial [Rickettsiales bacterium]|nr:transposase [Rickettsiales bacterium]